jgi:hypothetical protein
MVVVQKMNAHLKLRQYSDLAQLLTQQATLQSSASDVAERNAASENVTCCVTTLTDHLQAIYESARRELPRLSKRILGADALAQLSNMLSEIDEAMAIAGFIDKLKGWRDELHTARDGHVAILQSKAREQLKSHAFSQLDRVHGYLVSICEHLRLDHSMLESLDAEFRAELGRLDDLFDCALKEKLHNIQIYPYNEVVTEVWLPGGSHPVDQILRGLDFQPSASSDHSDSIDLRSNICDGCTAKLRNLLGRLRRETDALCRTIQSHIDSDEIRGAYDGLRLLRTLQSCSDFVRKETAANDEYRELRKKFEDVKESLLTQRKILHNATKANQFAREFLAIGDLEPVLCTFFRRRRGYCLDQLKTRLDACIRGLFDIRVVDLDSRAVIHFKDTMVEQILELVKYETALQGLGCDEEIERIKQDAFDELKGFILQLLDTIDARVEEGKWNEVDLLNKFVKFAFDDVLKSCNWSSEWEKCTLIAAIEKRLVNLDEKGARLRLQESEIETSEISD